ncbi:MAG: hypothetical protein HUU60_10040 [Armatimonadetes bacterium]|nr:hypothetical protein [Armatimonadota bacterium]
MIRLILLLAILAVGCLAFGQNDDWIEQISAPQVRIDKDRVYAVGPLTAKWKEFVLSGGRLEGSRETGLYRLYERARIESESLTGSGAELFIDAPNESWRFVDGRVELRSEFLQGRTVSSVYLSGQAVSGVSDQASATLCTATTCDHDPPHWQIEAGTANAIADDRLILRRVRLRALGVALFTLPRLVIPLRPGASDRVILPEVGQNVEEGFFLKYAVGYGDRGSGYGQARIDLMSKKGVGFGLDQQLGSLKANVYALRDQTRGGTTITARALHEATVGSILALSSLEYSRNSFLQTSNAFGMGTALTWKHEGGTARLSARQSANQSGGYTSDSTTISLTETGTAKDWSWNGNIDFKGFSARSGQTALNDRREYGVGLTVDRTMGRGRAQFEVLRRIPVASSAPFFGGLEKAPQLTYFLPAVKIGPTTTSFRGSIGHLAERGSRSVSGERLYAEANGSYLPYPSATLGYGLQQSFYSDGTAQYVLRSDMEQRIGSRGEFALRWNYLRPYGYSPFQFDRSGIYNSLTADLRVLKFGDWNLSAQTGYDLQADKLGRDAWRTLWLNANYEPSNHLRWRTNLTYDPNRDRTTGILTDVMWNFGASNLYFNARFDPQRDRLASANLRVEALNIGRTKLWALLSYNGYLNRFESRQFMATYDLHCVELELRFIDNPFGFRRDREISMFLRLKALPSEPRFGYGQFGQPVGGIGEIF